MLKNLQNEDIPRKKIKDISTLELHYLVTLKEIRVALRKQGVTDYKWRATRKSREENQTNPYNVSLNQSKISPKIKKKMDITSRKWNNRFQDPWDALNVRDMAATGRAAVDVRRLKGVAQKTQTTRGNSGQTKPNAQTATKTILLSQDLAEYTEERERGGRKREREREIIKILYGKFVSFVEDWKTVKSYTWGKYLRCYSSESEFKQQPQTGQV